MKYRSIQVTKTPRHFLDKRSVAALYAATKEMAQKIPELQNKLPLPKNRYNPFTSRTNG